MYPPFPQPMHPYGNPYMAAGNPLDDLQRTLQSATQVAQGLGGTQAAVGQLGQAAAQLGPLAGTLNQQLPSLTASVAQAATGIQAVGQGASQLPALNQNVQTGARQVSSGLYFVGGVMTLGLLGFGAYAVSQARAKKRGG